MDERTRRADAGSRRTARYPLRPQHRKGRSRALLYAAVAAVAVLLVAGGVGAVVALRARTAPKPGAGAKASAQTSSTPGAPSAPATSSPAGGAAATRAPEAVAAASAAAVKAAALPYPGAPSVTPETIRKAKPARKLVAITLDDGIPFDTRLLDYLESRNVRCTTFMLGQAVKAHPDLMKRLDADGWEIANHTWDHKTLTKLSDSQIRDELERTQKAISAVTGDQVPYMRPPGGGTNKRVQAVAGELGYRVVLWNRTFADTSKYATPEKLFHNIMDGLQPGDIILCHWGGKSTYEAMRLIIPEMEKRGFTPVTLSELLADSSGNGAAVAPGESGAATDTAPYQ